MRTYRTLAPMAERGQHFRYWYHVANATIRDYLQWWVMELHVDTIWDACAITAIFSPRVHVPRNIAWAKHYISTGTLPDGCMFSHRAALAHFIATGEIRGPKTRPFAHALNLDESACVIDTWMFRALDAPDLRPSRIPECQRRITRTAHHLGWTIAQTQAAIWYATMIDHGRTNVPFMEF